MTIRPSSDLSDALLATQRDRVSMLGDVAERMGGFSAAIDSDDHEALLAQLNATRAMLRATTGAEVVAVVATLVRQLGGGVVPARFADASNSLPLDLSLGLTEPMIPWTEPISVTAMRLAQLLPSFIEDAHLVLIQVQGVKERFVATSAT